MSADPLSSAWSRLALLGARCQAGHAEDGLGLFSGLILGIASALPPSHSSVTAQRHYHKAKTSSSSGCKMKEM